MKRLLIPLVALSLASLACGLASQGPDLAATNEALSVALTVQAQRQANPTDTTEATTPTEEATSTQEPATDVPTDTSVPPTVTPQPTATTPPTPTPTPYVVPNWPLVQQGDQGPRVRALQYLLRSQGYNVDADGIFGVMTRARVIEFQGDKGLAKDGIVGPQTWSALITGKTVKQGSTGDAVRAAQVLLKARFGYSDVTVDGIFGPITNASVKDFQGTYDLQVDGIVGSMTWKALVAIP